MRPQIYISFVLILFYPLVVKSQNGANKQGFGIYKKYDQSFVTPDLRGKQSVSLGVISGLYGADLANFEPSVGFHLGYNYLVLGQRKLKSSRKDKYRDEIKLGLGLHVNVFTENEFMVMGTFYKPWIHTRGRLFSWDFFSEYGIGVHKTANLSNEPKPTKLNLSVQVAQMRFVKQPLFLHFHFNYAASNNLFSNERLNVGFILGLRYYIFKHKI